MSPSAFLDRGSPPRREELERTLGKAAALWNRLTAEIGSAFAPTSERWSYSGKTLGWLLQLRRGSTTVVNLVPGRGGFVASLALNEKACRAAEESGLSAGARAAVASAPEYAEGRGVRIEVRGASDLADALKLAAARMAGRR